MEKCASYLQPLFLLCNVLILLSVLAGDSAEDT